MSLRLGKPDKHCLNDAHALYAERRLGLFNHRLGREVGDFVNEELILWIAQDERRRSLLPTPAPAPAPIPVADVAAPEMPTDTAYNLLRAQRPAPTGQIKRTAPAPDAGTDAAQPKPLLPAASWLCEYCPGATIVGDAEEQILSYTCNPLHRLMYLAYPSGAIWTEDAMHPVTTCSAFSAEYTAWKLEMAREAAASTA